MFFSFKEKKPSAKIEFSQYKNTLKEVAWNIKKAYRSTCLDRVDVNYKWHRESLRVVANLLATELAHPQEDADEAELVAEQPPDELTWVLIGDKPPQDANGELTGEALDNAQLVVCLKRSLRLTKEEWASCHIFSLHSHHYIRVEEKYFQPGKPLAQQLIKFAALEHTSQVICERVCAIFVCGAMSK